MQFSGNERLLLAETNVQTFGIDEEPDKLGNFGLFLAIGALVGQLGVAGIINRYFGRRRSSQIAASTIIFAVIMQTFTDKWGAVLAGRILMVIGGDTNGKTALGHRDRTLNISRTSLGVLHHRDCSSRGPRPDIDLLAAVQQPSHRDRGLLDSVRHCVPASRQNVQLEGCQLVAIRPRRDLFGPHLLASRISSVAGSTASRR